MPSPVQTSGWGQLHGHLAWPSWREGRDRASRLRLTRKTGEFLGCCRQGSKRGGTPAWVSWLHGQRGVGGRVWKRQHFRLQRRLASGASALPPGTQPGRACRAPAWDQPGLGSNSSSAFYSLFDLSKLILSVPLLPLCGVVGEPRDAVCEALHSSQQTSKK